MLDKNSKIYVAGHNGMVGSAIVRRLRNQGFSNIITQTRTELDLCDQSAVKAFFSKHKFDAVYLAAARVGGIFANNTYPADFIYQNLMIESNIIHESWQSGVKRLLFLGSTCIYPKLANQPIKETELLTGPLETTNEPYAIAKIAGIKLCESYNRQHGTDFRSIMPTNLYGPNDNFHPDNSHVIPAILRRFHESKLDRSPFVTVWGSGNPKREFLHVDDMASACLFLMELDRPEIDKQTQPMVSHINAGTGSDTSIRELASIISEVVGYKGEIRFDKSKPDGPPRKLSDTTLINSLGWHPKISLPKGLKDTYQWFLDNQTHFRS